jgi:predicted transcriptional regulator
MSVAKYRHVKTAKEISVDKNKNAILLSIRAEHAYRIFTGSKHYELRKVIPVLPFNRVFLYETGGTGIIGCFDVGRIIKAAKAKLWEQVGIAATTLERFNSYFSSVNEGYAIEILNPIRFDQPLTVEQLNGDFIKLNPPQSFIMVRPGQPLYRILEDRRKRMLALRPAFNLTLKRIRMSQRRDYKQLVKTHVGSQYDDIDDSFAASTLQIHDLGSDPSGFFTTKKEVLAIYDHKTCLGFTTLTYKSVGCVKTGPTMLYEQFHRKGYGLATRRAIEARLRPLHIRKIYCTCPDTAQTTIRYLLASGLRIEAHLERHYSTIHNEIVFGKLLLADEQISQVGSTAKVIKARIIAPEKFDKKSLIDDFRKMFSDTWRPVDAKFAKHVIEQAIELRAEKIQEKPKRLVCLGAHGRCVGAIVLLPKRGGAVKGLLLRSTNDNDSLKVLIESALRYVTILGGRKLYFLHPLADSRILAALKEIGFLTEGLLRAPYVPGQDVVIASKFTV